MRPNNYFFIFLLILMSSLSIFATDIYLPALPKIAVFYSCSESLIQQSFTVFLLGLAVCHLLSGALSDRFGHKKVVLVGFTLFTLASLLCATANHLSEFIFFRFLQAIGGGVGSVISRSLVADNYDRDGSVKIFSTIFPFVSLSAAIAPLIGGYLTDHYGWQSSFIFMAGIGLILVLLVIFLLKNKDAHSKDRHLETLDPLAKGIRGYRQVMNHVEFLCYVLIVCASFAAFRCYVVESPFYFVSQGYSAEEMGRFYVALSITYVIGNLVAKKCIHKMSLENVLKIGMIIFVLGAFLLIGTAHFYPTLPFLIIGSMSVITLGNGFIFPVASAGALTVVRVELSGTASGILGASGFLFSAFSVTWIGALCHGAVDHMSLFIGMICSVGIFSYLLLTSIHSKSRQKYRSLL